MGEEFKPGAGELPSNYTDFSIDAREDEAGNLIVMAGFVDAQYRYRPVAEHYVAPPPTKEELDEILEGIDDQEEKEEERRYWAEYDPEAEYVQEVEQFLGKHEDIQAQCDLLVDALAAARNHERLSEEANRAFTLLSNFVEKVSQANRKMYDTLPPATKRLAEYADRVVQLKHLYTGSSYTTPFDRVYSDQEEQQCVEDFCRGAEEGLRAGLTHELGSDCKIELDRPEHARVLNATSNLGYAIIERLEVPNQNNEVEDAMLNGAVRSFTASYYRQASSPA